MNDMSEITAGPLSDAAIGIWSQGVSLVTLIHVHGETDPPVLLLWLMPQHECEHDEYEYPWYAVDGAGTYESTDFGLMLHPPSSDGSTDRYRERLASVFEAAGIDFTTVTTADD